jgi:hypothetical protein
MTSAVDVPVCIVGGQFSFVTSFNKPVANHVFVNDRHNDFLLFIETAKQDYIKDPERKSNRIEIREGKAKDPVEDFPNK